MVSVQSKLVETGINWKPGFHLFVVSLGGVAQPLVPRTVTAVDGAGTVDVGS